MICCATNQNGKFPKANQIVTSSSLPLLPMLPDDLPVKITESTIMADLNDIYPGFDLFMDARQSSTEPTDFDLLLLEAFFAVSAHDVTSIAHEEPPAISLDDATTLLSLALLNGNVAAISRPTCPTYNNGINRQAYPNTASQVPLARLRGIHQAVQSIARSCTGHTVCPPSQNEPKVPAYYSQSHAAREKQPPG